MEALYPFFGILLNPVLVAAAMAMSSVSVVTNALRLRGFRRPVSAEAFLHPSWGERVREYAYLAGIGLVALAVGLATLILARPEHTGGGTRGADHTSMSVNKPVEAAATGTQVHRSKTG